MATKKTKKPPKVKVANYTCYDFDFIDVQFKVRKGRMKEVREYSKTNPMGIVFEMSCGDWYFMKKDEFEAFVKAVNEMKEDW